MMCLVSGEFHIVRVLTSHCEITISEFDHAVGIVKVSSVDQNVSLHHFEDCCPIEVTKFIPLGSYHYGIGFGSGLKCGVTKGDGLAEFSPGFVSCHGIVGANDGSFSDQ